MPDNITLTVRKIKRSYLICAGRSIISRKFRTKEEAETDLETRKQLYLYWAGSVSVSIENTTPVIINVD